MRTRQYVVAGATALAAVAVGTGVAVAGADAEDTGPDRPIVGADLEQAAAAALEHLGGGRVTGTEVDDEESWYEVEVTLPDGRVVDVQLTADFRVVGDTTDAETD